ncbi:MAG: 16S rRNA (guanine(527)-N(7))-methyltransferase RsmG [Firmicutes bacterium]|nr:16S rRNA (guanine(527)-N(7))-methyltransferase RsmG [Bacillota bacterium]
MDNQFLRTLKKITGITPLEIEPQALHLCDTHYNLLVEENRKFNLTSVTGPVEAAEKHFLDSFLLLPDLAHLKNPKVLDVGSGAGFPGLPLKICRTDLDMTLLDAVGKKTAFIEMVIKKLKLKQARALQARAEDHAVKYREYYDMAVSRAVAEMKVLLELTLPLVRMGGKAVISKGPGAYEELAAAENALKILGGLVGGVRELVLPISGDKRAVIVIEKVAPTPEKYPRRPGIPRKRPL